MTYTVISPCVTRYRRLEAESCRVALRNDKLFIDRAGNQRAGCDKATPGVEHINDGSKTTSSSSSSSSQRSLTVSPLRGACGVLACQSARLAAREIRFNLRTRSRENSRRQRRQSNFHCTTVLDKCTRSITVAETISVTTSKSSLCSTGVNNDALL